MMWLLGALGLVRKALSALVGLCARYPLQCALVASLLALGAVWHVKSGQVESANRRTAAQVALVAKWKAANDAATAWAKAEAARKDTLASDITKGANDVRNQAASLRAGNDYAARHVCLRVTPATGARGSADLSGAIHPAGQPADPPGDAELVAVARPDFDAATVNSADLLNAYKWGQAMIAAGLAK